MMTSSAPVEGTDMPMDHLASSVVSIKDYYQNEMGYILKVDDTGHQYSCSKQAIVTAAQGFGVLQTLNGATHLAAYFSEPLEDHHEAPRYDRTFYIAMQGAIFCISDGSSAVKWKRGVRNRSFAVSDGTRSAGWDYSWPWTRQLVSRLLGDPFNFISDDFLEEVVKLIKFYHPTALR